MSAAKAMCIFNPCILQHIHVSTTLTGNDITHAKRKQQPKGN